MLSRNTILTIFTKFLILLLNFALVLFTTRTWGSEGRGEIALVFANISIITILANVFCGSTIAFHSRGYQREFLLSISLAGASITSVAGAVIFSFLFGFKYFLPLLLISFLLSLTTAVSTYWLGKNNFLSYNILNLLGPMFVFGSLMVLYFLFDRTTLNTYWQAYYLGILIVIVIGIVMLLKKEPFRVPVLSSGGLKNILGYGISNEFNYFLQFLNYRLPYYFITAFLGLGKLGIFSIVVSISEAVWIISNSMSAILFSSVINTNDLSGNRQETIVFARQSFLISFLLLLSGILIPDNVYRWIFGDEFMGIRKYLLYIAPGIIAIAVSNLYGHYFAGIGKLKILRNKSLLGLIASLVLLPVLVKKYQLTGACISMNISYVISALYLWYKFRREFNSESTLT